MCVAAGCFSDKFMCHMPHGHDETLRDSVEKYSFVQDINLMRLFGTTSVKKARIYLLIAFDSKN